VAKGKWKDNSGKQKKGTRKSLSMEKNYADNSGADPDPVLFP
jgi:hypothetical protein